MKLLNNRKLSDISVRNQFLIERVKAGMVSQLDRVLLDMRDELKDVFAQTDYQTLDGLTKAQINNLIRSIREVQSRQFSRYTSELMEMLRDFMDATASVNRRVWAWSRLTLDADEDAKIPAIPSEEKSNQLLLAIGAASMYGLKAATENNRLWSVVNNEVIPATGRYVLPEIQTFTTNVQAQTESTVRKAWANKNTVSQVVGMLTNTNRENGASVTSNALNSSRAVIATISQHVYQAVTTAIASALFGRYRWDSVIDSVTTPVCRERNQKTWLFGYGPVPPAHTNCRSHVTPIVSGDSMARSLYSWLREQPHEWQVRILGEAGAAALEDGRLTAANLPRIVFEPMTFAEYQAQVATILQ